MNASEAKDSKPPQHPHPHPHPAGQGRTPTPGALLRYRVMAYATGVLLLVLGLVAMPLKYLADEEALVGVVGFLHGWLYVAYLVTAFQLSFQLRWKAVKTVLVLLAGTVPFMSFVAERRVMAELARAHGPAAPASRV